MATSAMAFARSGSSSLRVCSFNVHELSGQIDNVTNFLLSVRPDVICLQEIGFKSMKSLQRRLSEESGVPWNEAYAGAYYLGNALLSRHEIVWKDSLVSSVGFSEDRSAARVLLKFSRTSSGSDGVTGERYVACVATHLAWESEDARSEQVTEFLKHDWSEAQRTGHRFDGHLLCGDLNALTRTDYSDKRWKEIGLERNRASLEHPKGQVMTRLRKEGYTDAGESYSKDKLWTTSRYNSRIDYILASKDFSGSFRGYQVVDAQSNHISDHHLVFADVAWT